MANVYVKGVQLPDTIEVNNMIDAKLSEVPGGGSSSSYLNYKGHVSTIDSLPSCGQENGSTGTSPSVLSNDILLNGGKDATYPGYQYFLYTESPSTGYNTTIATNHPETIKGISIGVYSGHIGIFVKIEPTTDKPVCVRGYDAYNDGFPYINSSNQEKVDRGQTIYTSDYRYICMTPLENDGIFCGNITSAINFMDAPRNTFPYRGGMTTLYSYASNQQNFNSFEVNGLIYNEGMQLIKFDETYQGSWVTGETDVVEGDMYTATDDYLVFVADSKPSWKRWSNCYTKSEVDALIDGLRVELSEEILNPPTT